MATQIGSTVTLRTVTLDAHGRFGSLARIVPGRSVSYPVAVTGSAAPVLGLTLESDRPAGWQVAIARP